VSKALRFVKKAKRFASKASQVAGGTGQEADVWFKLHKWLAWSLLMFRRAWLAGQKRPGWPFRRVIQDDR
jgi:hypothetical protein